MSLFYYLLFTGLFVGTLSDQALPPPKAETEETRLNRSISKDKD